MGLLDDLKQQADTLRQKQQDTKADFSQNLLKANELLKDGIQYWLELFNSLNVIKPVIPRDYYLEAGATKLESLMQCDYEASSRRVTVDQRDYIEAIVLRFRCAADRTLTVEKQTDPLVQRMREQLWMYNLKFQVKEVKNDRGYVERGIFTVNCEVPVTITIASDMENGRLKINTKNLEKFGEYSYLFDYDEFGKAVLEELGKVIISKPNSFRTMGRHQEAMRITTTRVPRIEQEEMPAAEAPTEGGRDPTKSFIGNIRSLLKR